MRTLLPCILFLGLLSAAAIQAQGVEKDPYLPPSVKWTRIKKVGRQEEEIARFALSEYNAMATDKLDYVRIYRGYIFDTYYRLFIQAKHHDQVKKCEAAVFWKLGGKLRWLMTMTC